MICSFRGVLLASTLQAVPRNKGESSLCQENRHKSPAILLSWQHQRCSREPGTLSWNHFNAESLSYVIQEATKLSTGRRKQTLFWTEHKMKGWGDVWPWPLGMPSGPHGLRLWAPLLPRWSADPCAGGNGATPRRPSHVKQKTPVIGRAVSPQSPMWKPRPQVAQDVTMGTECMWGQGLQRGSEVKPRLCAGVLMRR